MIFILDLYGQTRPIYVNVGEGRGGGIKGGEGRGEEGRGG